MEVQDRNDSDTLFALPSRELLIRELMAEGFSSEGAKDFAALEDVALLTMGNPVDCKWRLEALRSFRRRLTYPTSMMVNRLEAFDTFLLTMSEYREEEVRHATRFREKAFRRYLDAVYGPQPLFRRLYRALFYKSDLALFIRIRILRQKF
ncbi:MAG: hypothetical protein ACRC44_08535 [Bifidobacterium asteroides]